MKTIAILLLITATVCAVPDDDKEWKSFKNKFGKSYGSPAEEGKRKDLFKEKQKQIEDHNAKFERGEVTYTQKINKFADETPEEVLQKYTGYREDPTLAGILNAPLTLNASPPPIVGTPPASVNWTRDGAVTPVKDQGSCGSCYTFSTVGAIEGCNFIVNGRLTRLSEQQVLDCSSDRKYGNGGCNGGWMTSSFQYVIAQGGIDTEACYPYVARKVKCKYSATCIGAKVSSYVEIPGGDEAALTAAIVQRPVAVAIDVENDWMNYASGVFSSNNCSKTSLNHAVLAVGYGTTAAGEDYYIIKNSWGLDWGDHGYILMSRNKNNQCGIATKASYPICVKY